jgi:CheY-like chemotaxis protein
LAYKTVRILPLRPCGGEGNKVFTPETVGPRVATVDEVVPQKAALSGTVLVVDDDENDLSLILRAFERGGLQNSLQVVKGGATAVAYLGGEPPYHDRAQHPVPVLVLLDINMPRVDGFEVLKWIRRQPSLKRLPVVMLTASEEIATVNKAYQLGATSFLVKPLDFWNAAELMQALHRLVTNERR